jgi:hypothetical protein
MTAAPAAAVRRLAIVFLDARDAASAAHPRAA